MAVSRLSGADQSVRRPARNCRTEGFSRWVNQSRPDGSGAAAQRRRVWRGALDDGGRPLGGDGNGRGRERRPRHHHFQRPGDAALAPAQYAGARRGRRHRRIGAVGAPDRHRRRSGAGLRLRAHGRRSGSGVDWPPVVRGGGADRAGLSWRALLAPRDCAGRDRRYDDRRAGLVLPAASCRRSARNTRSRAFWPMAPWRSHG